MIDSKSIADIGSIIFVIDLPLKDIPNTGLMADVFKVSKHVFTKHWKQFVPEQFIQEIEKENSPYIINYENKTIEFITYDGVPQIIHIGEYLILRTFWKNF